VTTSRPSRYHALLHLAAALANSRTPAAKVAQLDSGRSDALLAGHEPAAIDAALDDLRVLLDARHAVDPLGRDASSSTPAARERLRQGALAARETVARHLAEPDVDLLGDAASVEDPADEHDQRKAALRANRESYVALGADDVTAARAAPERSS